VVLIQADVIENFTCQRQALVVVRLQEAEVSSNKSRDFKSRCEGALDEIASVGGDILLAEMQWKRESCADGGGGLHLRGIICWWALGVAFKVPRTYATWMALWEQNLQNLISVG
jgi:hypothetical protein